MRLPALIFSWLALMLASASVSLASTPANDSFSVEFCLDCHTGAGAEAGLELDRLPWDLKDPARFARWERLYDRVASGEMPPEDAEQPSPEQRERFLAKLRPSLVDAHARSKGTVLRRLNRREYQNTMNDLFGTHLDLAGMLPEDGKAHEFDNVGASLGLSMVHLQRYIDAATLVLETAIVDSVDEPQSGTIVANYAETREGEKFIGQRWKQLDDGAVVRFSGGGYPSGMMRGTSIRNPGRYRVQVRGYAYQSDVPVTFSVGGTSFVRGSEKPIYGFWSFPPGKPGDAFSIEFEAWIEERYMIQIEPYGINDPQRYKRETIENYDGPGLAILDVTLEGPLVDQWPSRGHELIYEGLQRREVPPDNPSARSRRGYEPVFEIVSEDESAEVSEVLRRVASTAFRRPATEEEIAGYVTLFQQQRAQGETTDAALRTAVIAVFCSPNFLYLQEPAGKLDDHAVASRLAYFLTRTTPDRTLLQKADSGTLSDDKVLREETERLIMSDRFARFLVDFTDNWLDLRDLDFTVPDGKLFPEYDTFLRHSMPLETRGFLHELIESNLPVTHLVKSDFAMLNSRLAEHYGLPPVNGAALRKVSLPPQSLRGGLLSQASVLKVTANGTNTSPVTRGAWVMERILGTPPPPPPPGIPGVEPDVRGTTTLRELLDKHRDLASCNACHQKIDPPGFALEAFDPIGGFRERYRTIGAGDRVERMVEGRKVAYRLGPPVDSSGALPDNREFDGFPQFRDHLAADPEQLARTVTVKLLTFATGRELGFSDRAEVDRIVEASRRDGFAIRDLMHHVVQSEIFRSK